MLFLEAPTTEQLPYGLTSVAEVRMHGRTLEGHTHTTLCGHGTRFYTFDCPRTWDKTDTAERALADSVQFTTLTMETCGTVGYTGGLATDLAERERSYVLERALLTYFGPGATQISPTPLAPKAALMHAVHWATTRSSQRPTLHMTAALADYIDGPIDRHGNHLETLTGSYVSAGTGYGDLLSGGQAEVQSVSITGTPTTGTFVLTYAGRQTDPIAFDAAPAVVQTALEAITDEGLTVGGTAGAWTVTWDHEGPRESLAVSWTLDAAATMEVTTDTEGAFSANRIWVTGPVVVLQAVAHERDHIYPEENLVTSVNETAYSMSVDCYVGYVDVEIV